MLKIERFTTSLFDANCYLLYAEDTGKAVIVDPGVGAVELLRPRLAELQAEIGAVLLTHGHADHVWEADAASRLAEVPVPVFIPGPDLWGLDDPLAFFGDQVSLESLGLASLGLPEWVRPQLVEAVPSGSWRIVEGITIAMLPAKGHSAGSAIFLLGGECLPSGASESITEVALSGDVIFAGSVGRTDLVTGSEPEMRQTLRTLSNVLNPKTLLLPGHGGATQWGREMEENPYVARAMRIG